ncbi:HK97-gp10 family putative phage morphogenesis protein [Pseudomonas iridis]|uniref:HK97-gp10 family putative phage morphogenesis protein n=1 Tax=Pseudomonas iridis TaxID=2710587 RepID=UPI001B3323BD|nr:HK97-gp10 family putative phage morphogenesis protein [Pseudomonas iridis]MBP5971068.1 HK97 gp10 family phage protein [Pseudomonas iridis]
MARRSSVKGDFKLRGKLRKLGNEIESDLRPAMLQAAALVLSTQQDLILRDTGRAEQSLKVFVSKSGLDAQIGIRGKRDNQKFFYTKFIEYGTKGYRRGEHAIAGMPAHPWLRPSYDLNREEIVLLIRQAIASTLRKAEVT